MGGFNPISAVLGTALGFANKRYDAQNDYKQAQATYAQNEKEIAQNAKLESDRINSEAAKAATDRRNAFKRASAKQQAQFSAQGIDTSDGSGEAVLLGMLSENDEERKYRDRLDQLKRVSLAQETDNKNQRNLLALKGARQSSQDSNINSILGVL